MSFTVSDTSVLANGGISCEDATGELVVNGVPFNFPPCWCCPDLTRLWMPNPFKGVGSVAQPDADGSWGYPQHFDGDTGLVLPFVLTGHYDHTTQEPVAAGGEWEALQATIDYLRAEVFDMRDAGTRVASWEATLTMPSGEVREADVRMGPLELGQHAKAAYLASFTITVLSGSFRAVAS